MNKISEKFYNLIEMHYLKEFTRNLGEIEILDDRINCYVDNDKLKQYLSDHRNYLLLGKYKKPKELLKNINKPVYFIIENMKFNSELEVCGDDYDNNCCIEFRNCFFTSNLLFNRLKSIIFKENIFSNNIELVDYYFLKMIDNIEFINNNFCFIYNEKNPYPTSFRMEIRAQNMKFINSKFHYPKIFSRIWLYVKNIEISNSELYGDFLCLISSNIKRSNSRLCFNQVRIEETNSNYNKLNVSDIEASSILYNDIKILKDENDKYYIDYSDEEKSSKTKIYK